MNETKNELIVIKKLMKFKLKNHNRHSNASDMADQHTCCSFPPDIFCGIGQENFFKFQMVTVSFILSQK